MSDVVIFLPRYAPDVAAALAGKLGGVSGIRLVEDRRRVGQRKVDRRQVRHVTEGPDRRRRDRRGTSRFVTTVALVGE